MDRKSLLQNGIATSYQQEETNMNTFSLLYRSITREMENWFKLTQYCLVPLPHRPSHCYQIIIPKHLVFLFIHHYYRNTLLFPQETYCCSLEIDWCSYRKQHFCTQNHNYCNLYYLFLVFFNKVLFIISLMFLLILQVCASSVVSSKSQPFFT